MIVANETVARHFGKKPAVYRFHDKPLKMTPSEMHRKLRAVRGTEAEYAISMQILQAMPQAQYSATEKSHFGLASHGYLHFTSPIRRYADLTVHRLLKREKIKNLPEIAAQCSRTERTAVQLERDVSDMKKAAYMQDKIGQCFTAVVSGVVQWGAYVMLPNTVEGLIPANTLRKRHGLELGMKINVRLKDADTNERRVTFELA
jgi:ribonuclease R